MRAKHREEATIGEAMVERLQSIILDGATEVAVEGDVSLYATPSKRFFLLDGDGLRPVTESEASQFGRVVI